MSFYTFLPKLLHMSLTASVAIIFVLFLRFLLKKAPKVISYALWGIVLIRLLCPVSIESNFSLFGLADTPVEKLSVVTNRIEYAPNIIASMKYPPAKLTVSDDSNIINNFLPNNEGQLRADVLEEPIFFAACVWMTGILGMTIYTVISYARLKRRLITASLLRDNIYLADDITSPFVMGLCKPKIYLPSAMDEREQSYIILHEQHHIRRLDHIVKALAFAALCIHWFNPLVWAAFIIAGKDMEMSCDEAVINKIGDGVLADYTASLLSLATGKHIIAGMPLAFGEGDTKGRIRNLANWKKPSFWIVLAAIIACIISAVCLLTNPASKDASDPIPISEGPYDVVEVTYEVEIYNFTVMAGENSPTYMLTSDMTLSASGDMTLTSSTDDEWITLGTMAEVILTKENFDELFTSNSGTIWASQQSAAAIRKNTVKAWRLIYNQDILYYLLQQENGELYLAYGYYDYLEKDDTYSDDGIIRWLFKLAPKEKNSVSEVSSNASRDLEQAISRAILDHYASEEPDGLIHVESHALLASESISGTPLFVQNDHIKKEVVYLLVRYIEYSFYDEKLEERGGSYVPTAITFTIDENEAFTLEEYWEPRDGSYNTDDIRRKFPEPAAEEVFNKEQDYVDELNAHCYQQALSYMKTNGGLDSEIERLLGVILSSPAASSNVNDYISAHDAEYQTLLDYGEFTLRYCFEQFLQDGQTGLKGHIMAKVCEDISISWGEALLIDPVPDTGQAWFEVYYSNAQRLAKQYSNEDMEKYYPASWLLLQMVTAK